MSRKESNFANIFSVLVIVISLFACHNSQGQEKDIKKYFPSENVKKGKDSNRKVNEPKRKKVSYIIKNKSKGTLYGNPCFVEATRKMGFEYAIQTKGVPGSLGFWRRSWNNTGIRLRLILTRTPFWRLILKGKMRKCQEKSGDLVG